MSSTADETGGTPLSPTGNTEPVGSPNHPPIRPLDVDGLDVVTIGLVLFGLGAVLTAVLHAPLQARGDGWWFWVTVSGFLLGLVGLAYCRRRRARRQAGELLE